MSRPVVAVRSTQLILTGLLTITLAVCGAAPLRAQDSDHPLEASGIGPARGSFGVLPWEHIDTYSGSLVLTFTDLVLPGNAGLDLRVSRVFNSKSRRWKIAVGPSMNLNQPGGRNPRIQTIDGGKEYLFESAPSSGVYHTTSLWRFTMANRTLETPDGRIYHFLSDGRLSQIADVFGNTIDITYESNLTRVVQHLGSNQDREVVLVEDDQGRVCAVQYGGRTWTYTWGTNYQDLTVTPPMGPGWTFQWQDGAPMAWTYTVTTPNGGWVHYSGAPVTRDARQTSMVTTRESGGRAVPGATWSLQYSGSVDDVTVVSGPGRILRHVHTLWDGGSSRYLSQDSVFAADDLNLTNPLETRTYTYRPYPAGNPPGSITAVGLPDPGSDTDPYPLLIRQIETTRGSSTYSRIFTYCNESGQPACPADPVNDAGHPRLITASGDDIGTRTDTYSYRHTFGTNYIRGLPATIAIATAGENWPASYTYDDQGFLLTSTLYGVPTSFTRDGFGNVATSTDASNHTTSFSYAWGVRQNTQTPAYLIARGISSDGTVASETRQGQSNVWLYDALGRVIQLTPRAGAEISTDFVTTPGVTVTVSRNGASTTQTLDGYGRPVKTVTAMGVTTTVTYDADGRRVFESDPSYSSTPPGTSIQYDALDRVRRLDRPDGSWVTYGYDGLNVTITESVTATGETHVTHQHWVATGSPNNARLVGVQDAAGQWTSYAYTPLGGLTAVCGPGEATYQACTPDRARRTWTYDDQHRVASETHPESGTVTYEYFTDGMLSSRTDATGRVITYHYDGNHRLAGVQTTGRPSTVFGYDDWDNRTVADNGYARNTYTYEGGQRLSSQVLTLPGRIFSTSYTEYDGRDNLRELHYPSGQAVRYDYDADNRITRMYEPATNATYADAITYHPTGALAQVHLGNGLTETVTFDERARPTQIASPVLVLGYTYDHLGSVRTLTDSRAGYGQTFQYDALDRLTSASGVYGTQTFTYDALGNRCGVGSTCAYNPATQRLDSLTAGAATTIYNYDANGSLWQQAGANAASFTYTPDRMLETATVAITTTAYTYDSDGLRVTKSDNSTTHEYVHGLGQQLLADFVERNGAPAWDVAYLYLGSRLFGAIRPSSTPQTTFTKQSPGNGAMGLPSAVTLQWSSTLTSPTYAVCWDTLNNDTCDTGWETVGAATTKALTGLATGTYYWQVKETSSGALADTGAWWHFTVGTVTSAVSKLSPANGPVGLGRTVTLQWGSTLSNPTYWVCWDTSNNNTCNYMWWQQGTTPSRTLYGLPSGTYYWQVKHDPGGGAIEADGGTWWAFTVAPAPYAVSVVPWGPTQTWIRWADEAEDQTDFHVERSANNGPWTEILAYPTYQYLDPTPPCGPVQYRVRAHWQGLGLYSAYGPVVSIRACAPVAPGTLYIREWWGATRLDWEDRSWDESDFHVERQVEWGQWEEIVQLGAGTQNYVDQAQVCGLVAYRVRAHRHDSGQYSDYTNVASRTRSCSEPTAMMTPTGGGSGDASPRADGVRGAGWASWLSLSRWRSLAHWSPLPTTLGVLGGIVLLGALGLAWGRHGRSGRWPLPRRTWRTGVQLARASRHRRVPRLASRLAGIGSLVLMGLLWPASVLAQSGQVVEFYHLDALGSVRAVSNQQGQIISRHEFLPFGEEWTPGTPQRENKLFTGKERDPETSLDYFGARYYDSRVGRFTTVDPVTVTPGQLLEPQHLGAYIYARNNPLRFIDPTGETVRLLGTTPKQRAAELTVIKDAVALSDAEAASLLFDNNGELGVHGSMKEFMSLGTEAWQIGSMIKDSRIVEFGLTSSDLGKWGGARTLEPGQDGNGGNVRVLMNLDQLWIGNQRLYRTVMGMNLFEGKGRYKIGRVTPEVALWHEFGHAWGAIHGRGIQAMQTDAEAVVWENQIRKLSYGPFGPNNAQRLKHGK